MSLYVFAHLCQRLEMFLNSNPSSEVGYTLVDRLKGYSMDRENNCIIEQVETSIGYK